MRIDSLTSNDTQVPGATAALSLWRVGSIVEATAVRDATTGQLWLNIGDRRLETRIASGDSQGPVDGDQLKLRVLRNSPVLAFEVLETASGGDLTGDALRRYLPKQTTPMPLLANVAWLVRNTAASMALPKEVSEALDRLWQGLPPASSLTSASGLADALSKSGLFLESGLAQAGSSTQRADTAKRDFKALLLSLKKELQTRISPQTASNPANGPLPMLRGPLTSIGATPASLTVMDDATTQMHELAQQTDGTLARTVSTQLINVEAAQSGAAAWLVEIPIRDDNRAELLRFRFEREASAPESAASSWTVEVAMDLGAAGSLHVRVSLQNLRCSVQLRSESPQLIDELNRQAHLLTNTLQAEGLLVDRVICLHGPPIRDAGEQTLRLLDFHA